MNLALKTMDFVLKMLVVVLKMLVFVLKMLVFVLKMLDFVLKMLVFVLKMLDFAQQKEQMPLFKGLSDEIIVGICLRAKPMMAIKSQEVMSEGFPGRESKRAIDLLSIAGMYCNDPSSIAGMYCNVIRHQHVLTDEI